MPITFIEARVAAAVRDGDIVYIPPRWVYKQHLGGLVAETVCYDLKRLGVPEADRRKVIPTIDSLWDLGMGEGFSLARREYLGREVITMYCDDEKTARVITVPVGPDDGLFDGHAYEILRG